MDKCKHQFTSNPDDNDFGGSAIELDNNGDVSCSLCDKKWITKLDENFMYNMRSFKITKDNFQKLECDNCHCFMGYVLPDIANSGYFDAHICESCHKRGWVL